ncbi:MAG: tRNA uridine-5-carboxymethylaminomethyl(34) synthesis GTPase MnmE [Firmicutes bacterium]|nr:tRNA uridine-5-carboxymethylaminomethyl(34) synthesis GTPase MnmE [Bacillota bacterium]
MEDTIAAIGTPLGEGGIGIIRISGPASRAILEDIFECAGDAADLENRRLSYGRIIDKENNQIVDECMAVFMKAPKTYTAEDTAEIDCHGSMVSLRNALQLILRKGARLAEPGEFTKRAFLNGRIDLSQAEAVIDVVRAKTDRSFDVAISQLQGALSLKVSDIRRSLLDLLVDITVNIDYPDEDIEEITYEKMGDDLLLIRERIDQLRSTAHSGRMLREGLRIVICGRPNVGKSSLMNALLRENRAIVTEIPGTTRDTIEESVNIRSIPVNLIDTAGIHETEDIVERMGIERSKDAFNQADYILLVLDASQPLTEEDRLLISTIGNRSCLVVMNKQDLGMCLDTDELRSALPRGRLLPASMKKEEGISQIEDQIEELVYGSTTPSGDHVLVNNVRHIQLLDQAAEDLSRATEMIRRNEPLDFIEVDVRSAYDALGEIIGETVSDEILNEVFSRFCLGK